MTDQRPLALVTGAGGGIGSGVARMLEERGYTIIAVDLTQTAVDRILRQLRPDSIGVVNDATRRRDTDALAERIRSEWRDSLEILVCNAGVISPHRVADSPPQTLRSQVDVMLDSPIQLMAAAAESMTSRGVGRILATVSMGGVLSLPGSAAYSAAKAGLRSFLTALSAELHGTGVVVSGIYPSGVDTAMLRQEAMEGGSMLNFVGKILSVSDVVAAYERALSSSRLEVRVPATDGVVARLLSFDPQTGNRLLPLLRSLGKRGRASYLKRMKAAE